MARVGDRKITVEQFMNYIKQDTRLVLKARTVPGKTEILREMILDRLIEEAMLREDLLPKDRDPKAQEYLQAYQQLASRHFPKANVMPSEEELYKYYQQHPELFGIPAMVRVGQIQFRTPENADEKTKAEVKAKAEDTLKRLRTGESFSVLAEALTENPQGKVAKGDLGFLQPEKDAWLRKAVEGLAVGQFSEVLESPVGYEIILLQDKRDAMIAPYANVRDNVLGRIQQEAASQGAGGICLETGQGSRRDRGNTGTEERRSPGDTLRAIYHVESKTYWLVCPDDRGLVSGIRCPSR